MSTTPTSRTATRTGFTPTRSTRTAASRIRRREDRSTPRSAEALALDAEITAGVIALAADTFGAGSGAVAALEATTAAEASR